MSNTKQQPIIESHRKRVAKAKRYLADSPERISIFDREAYVEHYLLQNIETLLNYRLRNTMEKPIKTEYGLAMKKKSVDEMSNLIEILRVTIEVSAIMIDKGEYSLVWRAINEGALMRASKTMKGMNDLIAIVKTLDKVLSESDIDAKEAVVEMYKNMKKQEAHDANVKAVKGLNDKVGRNSAAKIEEIFDPYNIPAGATEEEINAKIEAVLSTARDAVMNSYLK